jgi:murein L,D-transpeptidase YafK
MRSFFAFAASALILACAGAMASAQATEKFIPTALLVDKATNTLQVTRYVDGSYQTIKTYHTTLGQVKGDKQDEGDMKTPEGIYTFKALLKPPSLAAQFGKMAFYIDFPNTYDRLAGRTGSGVMLHATNTPDRLNKDYDSLGCVVVRNEEIEEIRPYVKLGLTPILIFEKLTPEYLSPGRDEKLKSFFQSWIKAWETKDLAAYMDHYHSDFSAKGMNKTQWRSYKESLNKRYASIEIGPEDVLYYEHPKYSMITFTQNYRSKLKGGGWGHRSRGTKILYIAEEAGQPKIIAETYTTLMW